MYTKEQNLEIEKVAAVFKDYIKANPGIELVWSDKMGYVLFIGYMPERDDLVMQPDLLRSGERLCCQLLYEAFHDFTKERGDSHGPDDASVAEVILFKRKMAQYMEQLPEYEYVIDELFIHD